MARGAKNPLTERRIDGRLNLPDIPHDRKIHPKRAVLIKYTFTSAMEVH
jgi:hypothetical protein